MLTKKKIDIVIPVFNEGSIIVDTLSNDNLDILKKANIALRYLSLMRGKSDISQKSSETLKEHLDDKEFKFGII